MRTRIFALMAMVMAPLACQLGQGGSPFDGNSSATNPPGTSGGAGGGSPGGNNNAGGKGGGNGGGNNAGSGNNAGGGTGSNVPAANYGPIVLGRVDPSSLVLSWAATVVEAAFVGTGGSATFDQVIGTNVMGVRIDNGDIVRQTVTQGTPVTFAASGSGNHTVQLIKVNEPDLGTLHFAGMTINNGNFVGISAPSRRLEFVGDSISTGYGVLGDTNCTYNTAQTEDTSKAWSFLAADALQAEASVIAWEGRGLLRNGVGNPNSPLMPDYYQYYTATSATPTYTAPSNKIPQAVIVNLGTNDYTYISYATGSPVAARGMLDQTAFVAAYASFVQSIRSNYPSALIVLCTSPMLSDSYPTTSEKQWSSLLANVTAVQSQLQDANVVVLSIPTQTELTLGCNSHPGLQTQASMATQLTTLLKSKLGW